jgi:hypothetical protein
MSPDDLGHSGIPRSRDHFITGRAIAVLPHEYPRRLCVGHSERAAGAEGSAPGGRPQPPLDRKMRAAVADIGGVKRRPIA